MRRTEKMPISDEEIREIHKLVMDTRKWLSRLELRIDDLETAIRVTKESR